ncbi:MAG: fimbria major subunit [Bacteroidales bacterium]|nr:fimbria major subunit [Bacteroidales bacterium]
MKKIRTIFMLGIVAIGLSLTACNSDNTVSAGDGTNTGNTNVAVSLSLSLGNSNTRALPTDYNYVGEWAGNDEIKTVDIYLVDATKATVSHSTFDVSNGDYTVAAATDGSKQVILTPKKAIKTTAGAKAVYAVINANANITNALSATTIPEFDNAFKTLALTLANSGTSTSVSTSASNIAAIVNSKDIITMTNSEDVTLNVQPNITSDQTLAAAAGDASKNRVGVKVERASARVMVTTAANSYDVTSGNVVVGTVSDITWVLAQGENSLYVQRKTDYMTPNYAWMPNADADYYTNAGSKYDYSGLFENKTTGFGGTTVPLLSAYTELAADGSNAAAVLASLGLDANAVNGKFILPTTHTYGVGNASLYKKGNTAYVLVRAKYTPATYADGGTANTDGTFYLGANGKYYTTSANAVNPANGGVTNQTVAKYVGGKVLYYAWVNPDVIPDWYNSPVLRNNIYHIHITGFKTIGTNWNPLYPEDPEHPNGPGNTPLNPDPKPTPGPGEPNEPVNPIDPTDPLTTPETWMSVDITVMPWQVHSYGIDLGI